MIESGIREGSGNVCQYHADLAQSQLLFVGHYQEFESAAQSVAVTHQRAQFDDVGSKRYGELQRYNFSSLQFRAESRANAILAEFIDSAPAGRSQTVTKNRDLNARVVAIAGETPRFLMSPGCRLSVIAQSSFSIFDVTI